MQATWRCSFLFVLYLLVAMMVIFLTEDPIVVEERNGRTTNGSEWRERGAGTPARLAFFEYPLLPRVTPIFIHKLLLETRETSNFHSQFLQRFKIHLFIRNRFPSTCENVGSQKKWKNGFTC